MKLHAYHPDLPVFRKNYAKYADAWAKITPVNGSEITFASEIIEVDSLEIWIRYRSAVINTDQIVFDGRTFDINAVIDPDQKKRYLKLLCREAKK